MIGLIHTCSTLRMQGTGLNGGSSMQTNLSTVSCLFLPMSPAATVQLGWDVGTGWKVFFDDGTDVQAGDKLVFQGRSYVVKGEPQAFTEMPLVSHVEVSAMTENAHA